jgi:hypothetical protein
MSPEEQVRSALQALAEHDRALESSTSASAIFAQRRVVRRRSEWMWLGAVASAAAAALAVWNYHPALPLATGVTVVEHPLRPVPVAKVEASAQPNPAPVRRSRRVVRRAAEPQEIATEFFPLMDAPPPFESGQLVRMVVPASTMLKVGLPVAPERWNDRVQADVLVGEEGMARAIRFVSFSPRQKGWTR